MLFGDNFDYHEGDLVIGFYPSPANGNGSVEFASEIFKAVHLRALTTHTLHSIVIDLKHGIEHISKIVSTKNEDTKPDERKRD